MSAQPLKRSKALMPLSREHHFELLLAWKIRQGLQYGTAAGRIANYIRYMDDNLIKEHQRDEEELFLLPLLPDDALCERAMKEHAELRKLMDETIQPSHENSRFIDLAEAIEKHVRFEERVLFPHLEATISRERLAELEKIITAAHQDFRDNWEDVFWEKSNNNL